MRFEMIPMLVRRFDPNDPKDVEFEADADVPLPFGLPRLYIETAEATFKYGQETVTREWVAEWINRDPRCAFWIVADGDVYVGGSVSYNSNTKKSAIDTPLKYYYRLRATLVYLEDRTTLEHKPTRDEVVPPDEDQPEEDSPAMDLMREIGQTIAIGFGNNTRSEAGEIVITTLRDQPQFRGVKIINPAHGDHLMLLTAKLPPGTKRMDEIELTPDVRDRLVRDLKAREALPLDLSQGRINEWRTMSDVVDDVDWHMHIR